MWVPAADGARLPAFSRVMADIGDEQSIAQSSSTFSSHLRNVVRFMAAAEAGTLVLLDEIRGPTRPKARRWPWRWWNGCCSREPGRPPPPTMPKLKTFAQEHPLVSNASVAFDVASLKPTYRLEIGLPGKSRRPSPSRNAWPRRSRSWTMPAHGWRPST